MQVVEVEMAMCRQKNGGTALAVISLLRGPPVLERLPHIHHAARTTRLAHQPLCNASLVIRMRAREYDDTFVCTEGREADEAFFLSAARLDGSEASLREARDGEW